MKSYNCSASCTLVSINTFLSAISQQFQHIYDETKPYKRWKLTIIRLVIASLQLALTQIYASFPSIFAKQLKSNYKLKPFECKV